MTLFESLSDIYHTVAYFQLTHLLGIINLPVLLRMDHCLAVYSSFPLEARRTHVRGRLVPRQDRADEEEDLHWM